MTHWLTGKPMVIQPWHDLETLFISFTAICIWFNVPYCAKEAAENSPLNWIFEPYRAPGQNPPPKSAAYCKWERFRPDFDSAILTNLSSYFDCPAIRDLLTTLRNMCFPPSWGNQCDMSPSGFAWPEDVPRV